MARTDPIFEDLGGRRDYRRVGLVVVSLLAILLATMAVPALSPAGAGSPASSMVPIPEEIRNSGGSGQAGGAGTLGALSPGGQTGVGQSSGGESALQSQSTAVHFRVESTTPSYWRTGAYGRYTGDGWEQQGEARPIDGAIPVSGQRDESVTYEVTLEQSATALPTVWQPTRLSRDGLSVTSNGAIQTDGAVPVGTTYTGVSARPPDDPDLLRRAGTDYPAAIERRYTQLPADSRSRLTSVTADLTSEADTPYERASLIEQWLEANKTYSLNASHDPDRAAGVATQFVFDMDEGYCEYFATSMVAMLRSQDIPARYVVGYSTGEATGDRSYVVRGMHAHAWVEVYFPEIGWVRFDPTPGDARRQQEAESRGETPTPPPQSTATPSATTATDAGAPSETAAPTPTERTGTDSRSSPTDTALSPTGDPSTTRSAGTTTTPSDSGTPTDEQTPVDEQTQTDEQTPTEEATQTEDQAYDVSLNRTAVPGAAVTATVTRGGAPAADVGVLFNDDPIGRTDAAGNVTGVVPYESSLTVTVADESDHEFGRIGPSRLGADRYFAVTRPQPAQSRTYELNTSAHLAITGPVHTGSEVTVTALVSGEPVRNGTLSLNGTAVAQTDDAGRARVTFPTDPGPVTLSVERGAVTGSRTLRLGRLRATVEPTAPLALPLTDVRVTATVDNETVAGANVSVGGQQVATTGVDGSARVSLPVADAVTVGVATDGQGVTQTVSGLYLNAVLASLGGLALALAALTLARRYDITPRRLRRWLRLALQGTTTGLVWFVSLLDVALRRLHRRALLTIDHLRALVAGRHSPEALLAALRAWFTARLARAETSITAHAERVAAAASTTEAADPDAYDTIQTNWAAFLDHVSLPRPARRTPEAIAVHAIEVDDFPPAAVWTLVDAFRAVEYGQRDPDENVATVDEALAEIRRATTRPSAEADESVATDAGVAD